VSIYLFLSAKDIKVSAVNLVLSLCFPSIPLILNRSSVGCTYPDRLRGPPSLLYNGYRVFPGGKVRPGRDANHTHTSSAEVKKELS
jgi:hypothetical protein